MLVLATASAIRINDVTEYPLWSGKKEDAQWRRPYSATDSWEADDEHADHFKAWKQWGREQAKNKSNGTNGTNVTKSDSTCFYGQDQCDMVDVPTTKSTAIAAAAWNKRRMGVEDDN